MKSKATGIKRNKYVFMDVLRCFALIEIIYAHSWGLYADVSGGERVLAWIIKCAVYTAVPIFFMISGALLLKKEDDLKTLLLHRFLRFAVVLVFCQAFQYLYSIKFELAAFSLQHFVQVLYSDLFASHYWYLYSYLAYILMLPLLRKMVKGMANKDYIYIFAIYFAVRCVYPVQYLLWGNSVEMIPNFRISLFLMQDAVFYPVLGHYLQNVLDINKVTKKAAWLLSGAAAVLLLVSIALDVFARNLGDGTDFDMYTFACVPSAALFILSKRRYERKTPKEGFAAVAGFFSGVNFATYLFHNVYMAWLAPVRDAMAPHIGIIPADVVYALMTFLVGSAISFVIRLIPGVKKFI